MYSMDGWRWPFKCDGCGEPYPDGGFPFRCHSCGSTYDFAEDLQYAPDKRKSVHNGLSRYFTTFPLPPEASLISLGEGNTPLLALTLEDKQIYFKCEYLNPTGSFKDRGTTVLVSAMQAAGIEEAVEDSSGNAGSSFAAYAARAGIGARIFVPDYASGPKVSQTEAYGAEVIRVRGPRSAATESAMEAVRTGSIYASHAYLPHGIAGMATVAFEIVEELGDAPGSVVLPVGQGTLLLGLERGFQALQNAGMINRKPKLIAVQAQECAPIWAVFTGGAASLGWIQEGETIAEGIRIIQPLRGDKVLSAVEGSGGAVIAVDEENIQAGYGALARRGFFVEPTSAVVWPGILEAWEKLEEPIVAVLTGSGLKSATFNL